MFWYAIPIKQTPFNSDDYRFFDDRKSVVMFIRVLESREEAEQKIEEILTKQVIRKMFKDESFFFVQNGQSVSQGILNPGGIDWIERRLWDKGFRLSRERLEAITESEKPSEAKTAGNDGLNNV